MCDQQLWPPSPAPRRLPAAVSPPLIPIHLPLLSLHVAAPPALHRCRPLLRAQLGGRGPPLGSPGLLLPSLLSFTARNNSFSGPVHAAALAALPALRVLELIGNMQLCLGSNRLDAVEEAPVCVRGAAGGGAAAAAHARCGVGLAGAGGGGRRAPRTVAAEVKWEGPRASALGSLWRAAVRRNWRPQSASAARPAGSLRPRASCLAGHGDRSARHRRSSRPFPLSAPRCSVATSGPSAAWRGGRTPTCRCGRGRAVTECRRRWRRCSPGATTSSAHRRGQARWR
ncbi:hypothetical protein PVAP13_2KG404005 [Panicum virgatum]|uniref:Uncharacterized protein n=1 Tax=Panicum virgatum TaxID=38727 RepID=A0A8T0W9H6_PANVG|nr:hypothetical protein PVAP13_2KG404005 [Panicum virgatum]